MHRRGVLALGLAVTIAGAVGLVSMMNARADEVPGTPSADSSAATADDKPSPPATLPWGDAPSKIRVGKAGTDSRTLADEGFSAAPGDTSGDKVPRGRYGPKGHSNRNSFVRREKSDTALPKVAGVAAPAPTSSTGTTDANYYYNVGSMAVEGQGFYSNLSIAKPNLSTKDYHTLAEVAVQDANNNIVEVGWTVDRGVNKGDVNPHLFVYHWVNGAKSCYNGCGWEQTSDTVKPGDTLATGAKRFGIEFVDDAWWVSYDSEYIGYFPAKLWTSAGQTFEKTSMVQVFGEVASSSADTPCSQMGNGILGTLVDKTAAVIGSAQTIAAPTASLYIRPTPVTKYYATLQLSTRTFLYGGPGAGC
jgi:hypothetical protein